MNLAWIQEYKTVCTCWLFRLFPLILVGYAAFGWWFGSSLAVGVFQFGGGMEWCYSWKWLSMLCGDPLTERTDRGSHQVTWPARWMCMRGKKRKGGTICSTDPRALPLCPPSFPHSLSLSNTHSPSLTPSLPPSSPQWRPWEESRYDASWRHKRNDMLALYSSPLVGF